jgi:uncharacterized membrane protein YsdA (DUF1294 family)
MALVTYYYAAINAITFLVWGYDKLQAQVHRWRVSERTLLTLVLVGGAFGALLGMLIFRHKTRKPLFWIVVVIGCVFHAAVIYHLSR